MRHHGFCSMFEVFLLGCPASVGVHVKCLLGFTHQAARVLDLVGPSLGLAVPLYRRLPLPQISMESERGQ